MSSMTKLLLSRRMGLVVLTSFSSGLPLMLTASTLQAWMTDAKVDLATIGVFSLVGLPYTAKFLWSPFLDRYALPFLGRRRGWIFVFQVALALAIATMGLVEPKEHTALLASLAFVVAFFSASQDIVIDAWRTELLTVEELGPGAAAQTLGYRIAMLVSGALALVLADAMSWRGVYLVMALTMATGLVVTIFAPEPPLSLKPPRTIREAAVSPLLEFLGRPGSVGILAFILLYKVDVNLALSLITTFFMKLGFAKALIGGVNKGVGLVAVIAGTFAGGALLPRIGMKRALWGFGIAQGSATLCFLALAVAGETFPDALFGVASDDLGLTSVVAMVLFPLMVLAVIADNFFSGMGNAAYSAFLMSLCNPRFTATQFALLSSLMAVSRVVGTSPSGWLVEHLGWPMFFVICTLAMIPGLLFLTRFGTWKSGAEVAAISAEASPAR